jgi:hypothetical protein
MLVACVAASGASCPGVLRTSQIGTMPLPRTLPAQPTLDQIIATVHDNPQRVKSYVATQATLAVPGVPRLAARVACEPPRRFRLQARTSISGEELDLGSNDDLFWLWIRQHQPPVTLFCRHDRYDVSPARRMIPIRAEWMPELLGLVQFRPHDRHEGPYPLPDGRIEIRSWIVPPNASAADEVRKSTILDGITGLVLEQHLFSSAGQPLASVRTSRHLVDPPSGAALPRMVEVHWPASDVSGEVQFTLELTSITTNMPTGDPTQLWRMPARPGFTPVDIADLPAAGPAAAAP